ncbi:tetratricopeptide repeat protein [Bacteroidota bacterium]
MKKALQSLLLISIISILISTVSFSQTRSSRYGSDSLKCIRNASIYSSFYQNKEYTSALGPWNETLRICPKFSRNIYTHGRNMFKDRIDSEEDIVKKEELIDSLFLIYDLRIEHFGTYTRFPEGAILGQKGIDMIFYRKEDVEAGYLVLERSIELMGNRSNANVILTYMQCSRQLFVTGLIGTEKIVEDYSLCSDIAEYNLKQKPGDQYFTTAKEGIEQHFTNSGAADCEALEDLFKEKFAENPDDIDLIKKISKLLSNAECTESEFYIEAIEALYRLEPTANKAYSMARIFISKEEYDKATEYLNSAINIETDPITKSTYYHLIGSILFSRGDYQKSREYANKAIQANPDNYDSYILKGNIYVMSSSKFSDDELEKSSVFWLAVDYFALARSKTDDPEKIKKANDMIVKYSEYFPNSGQIHFATLKENDTYSIGGWIKENTTIRVRK